MAVVMKCRQCQAENEPESRFCESCGAQLVRRCPACGHELKAQARYCGQCGAALASGSAQPKRAATASAGALVLPEHAAATRDGERKTVTALFADIKGSTELEQDLDPEEARALIDPV